MNEQLDRVQQAEHAIEVLENTAYKAAMKSLRDQIHVQWKASKIQDAEGQRLLLQFARLADDFEVILSGMIEGGKFAQHQIDLAKHRNESGARKLLRKVF